MKRRKSEDNSSAVLAEAVETSPSLPLAQVRAAAGKWDNNVKGKNIDGSCSVPDTGFAFTPSCAVEVEACCSISASRSERVRPPEARRCEPTPPLALTPTTPPPPPPASTLVDNRAAVLDTREPRLFVELFGLCVTKNADVSGVMLAA